jgi:deazaflavin-dependent oxidoreductase (nitroreductase family)
MEIPAKKSTLKLTHFGRKSGKPFDVTIWFTVIGGELWIGSLDENRNWVKNLRAGGRARIDFGNGPQDVATEFRTSDTDKARYSDAVASKYPILSKLVGLFVRGKNRAVFLVKPA